MVYLAQFIEVKLALLQLWTGLLLSSVQVSCT